MIRFTALIAFALLVTPPAGAQADAQDHPVYDRMAETIAAIAPEAAHPYTRGWTYTGQRARSVRWHLAEPDDGDGWYRRTGWISESGRQAGVAVCGNADGVAVLGLQISGEDDAPLLAALGRAGTVSRLNEDARQPVWRFEQAGRETAMITATPVCTPPGSAAARTCRLHVAVSYAADVQNPGCRAP